MSGYNHNFKNAFSQYNF